MLNRNDTDNDEAGDANNETTAAKVIDHSSSYLHSVPDNDYKVSCELF